MNKLFTKIAALALGATMAVGVGVAVAKSSEARPASAVDTLCYTLDGTTTGGTNGYAEASNITQGGINWGVVGNTTTNPWRIGGKSISSRAITSKASVSSNNVTKVVINFGTKESNITVSKVTLNVGTATSGYTISQIEKTDTISSNTSLTFNRPSDKDWANRYFEFVLTMRNSASGSNHYIQLKSVQFYYDPDEGGGGTCDHTWDSGVVTTAATCTTAGVKTYTCTKCSETKTEAIAALGHDYVAGTPVAATCTEGGYTPYTCSRCGDSYHGDETAALGHNYVDGICSRCGAEEPSDVTFAYPGGSTTNMTGNNDAATLGADASHWSAVGYKNGNNNFPGLNTNGSIRLYGSSQNYIVFKTLDADTRHLTSVSITTSAKNFNLYEGEASFSTAISSTGSNPYVYTLGDGVTAFTIRNNSSTQSQIQSITVAYEDEEVETYTVSFNGNTASGSMADVTDVVGDYTLPANGFTVPSGKAFAGWKANNTGSLLSAGDTYDVQADVTFYAQWSDLYTVSFNGNTASGSMADVPNVAGNYTLPANGFTVPSGKEFLGWKANNSGDTLAAGATYNVSANVTFYAQWGNVWNVTFTAGANGTGSQIVSVSEGTYSLPAISTLTSISANTGYRFKDYTIGGTTYNAGTEVTISAATAVTVNFETKPSDTTYDFTTNFATYAGSWSGYGTHEGLSGKTDIGGGYEATIDLYYASKQSGTITDRPVFATKTASGSWTKVLQFTLTESGYKIDSITVTFAQWSSKTPDVALFKGNSASGTSLDTATIGTKNTLSASNFNGTTFTVGYCDKNGSSNVQSGLTSIYISISPLSSFGTLDHITITELPNTVYHVGETYSPTGLAVIAYDGADETTANFKDVTASVETDLDDPTPFVDGDVPGFDCDVQYTGDGGTDTKSFHVYVYALAEYELVTSEPDDWSGQYLIVGTKDTSSLAMNGGLTNLDVEGNHKTVTPDGNNVIEDGQELEWTIASYSTGYSIQGKSGKYIGWASGSNNGLTCSDTALVNTLSFSSGNVTISGTGGRNLALNTDGNGRFRYYTSGTVKLYRLKVSDNADAYAQLFLGAFTCDSSGINKPTFGWKEEGVTRWTWALLATEYNTLTAVEKEQFRLGVASESGTNIEKAIARYDYIVGKYYKTGLDTSFTDFMNRNPSAIGNSKIVISNTIIGNSNMVAIVVVTSVISLTAIGGYFFLRKRREQN